MKTPLLLLASCGVLMAPCASAQAQGGGGRQGGQGFAQQGVAGQTQGFQPQAQQFQAQGGRGPAAQGFAPGPAGRGPGGRGPGGRGGFIPTPPDVVSESFRAQASAVSGSGKDAQILLVTNYGWMRSTRTLKIGTEFQDGWTLKELDAGKAVLAKADSPDKIIDLSRWTGGFSPNPAADPGQTQTRVGFGSIGTVRGSGQTPRGAIPQAQVNAARPVPAPPPNINTTRGPTGPTTNVVGGRGAVPGQPGAAGLTPQAVAAAAAAAAARGGNLNIR